MQITRLVLLLSFLHLSLNGFLGSKKRKKHKYKVVTPKPTCIEKQESVFSVTGFLTFAVVSATAVSNVIANIDNNNNNNNNNDNNDNVNNNNQISDSADATNMGNARLLSCNTKNSFTSLFSSISPSVCLPLLLCEVLQQAQSQNLSSASKKTTEISVLAAALSLADVSCISPTSLIAVYKSSLTNLSCLRFSCD